MDASYIAKRDLVMNAVRETRKPLRKGLYNAWINFILSKTSYEPPN